MKKMVLLKVLLVPVFVWAVWAGVLSVHFEKKGDTKAMAILKFDGKAKGAEPVQKVFRVVSQAVDSAVDRLGGPVLVRRCSQEPVLFGTLFVLLGISICTTAFLVRLVRDAVRFY